MALPKYQVPGFSVIEVKTSHQVSRKHVIHLVRFRLPDEMKEKMSAMAVAMVEGDRLMTFYCDPPLGSRIAWCGFTWEVSGYLFDGRPFNSKNIKPSMPLIEAEFVTDCLQDDAPELED